MEPKSKLKNKWQQYKRVLKITKKPNKDEFWSIVKVTGLGIIFIGLIGFAVLSLKIIAKGMLGV
jgi:protein transport protein SEC61 subunit gamma and related proteins